MSTRTFAKLEVSRATFSEIWKALLKSGYTHSLITTGPNGPCIDAHGVALVAAKRAQRRKKAPARKPLHEVNWLHLGTTKQYDALKKRLQHVVHDVVAAGCIDEIVINDIVRTFQQHGFIVVPEGKA